MGKTVSLKNSNKSQRKQNVTWHHTDDNDFQKLPKNNYTKKDH